MTFFCFVLSNPVLWYFWRLIWNLYALITMWKCTCAKYHFVSFKMPCLVVKQNSFSILLSKSHLVAKFKYSITQLNFVWLWWNQIYNIKEFAKNKQKSQSPGTIMSINNNYCYIEPLNIWFDFFILLKIKQSKNAICKL